MQISRLIRVLLATIVGLIALLLLIVLLYVTESAFVVWKHLQQAPTWFLAIYSLIIFGLAVGVNWLLWRILRSGSSNSSKQVKDLRPLNETELIARIAKAESTGIDVTLAQQELTKLQERKEIGLVYISLFGEISSGKSSLIKALLPEAQLEISAKGGVTRNLTEYRWRTIAGDELILVDVPGTNEIGNRLDVLTRTEAQRAHLVLYICDGDLSRSQWQEFEQLLLLNKPSVLVLNKTDRYTTTELELLKTNLRNRIEKFPLAELVSVQAGGIREIVRILPDGTEELVTRPLIPQVTELQNVLQRRIDDDPKLLESLRDSAVFCLIANKLDEAELLYRRRKADEMVEDYTRKAMLGAMAAVAPGADILIQGYLGISLIRALSDLYQVPVHKTDRSRLLNLVQQQVGKSMTLLLAVAGNALKAFPGVGTLAGGLLHAVAYGLIFRSLGQAIARSFETRGELHPIQTIKTFKETLGEQIEVSGREMAHLALRLAHEKPRTSTDSNSR
ncbi:hypothetical protein TI03_04120 [Achromatium sp. WMS1]|nr:hypothetical protein TI03_04120 [Achromatium sp. WMS1]